VSTDRGLIPAVTGGANHDTVYVGRIREDMTGVRTDRGRWGQHPQSAATNAIQIAEFWFGSIYKLLPAK
jgi:hypothetical protein